MFILKYTCGDYLHLYYICFRFLKLFIYLKTFFKMSMDVPLYQNSTIRRECYLTFKGLSLQGKGTHFLESLLEFECQITQLKDYMWEGWKKNVYIHCLLKFCQYHSMWKVTLPRNTMINALWVPPVFLIFNSTPAVIVRNGNIL